MRVFADDAGSEWVASARQDDSPRHHTRWFLVFHASDDPASTLPLPEVRWQSAPTAERTLRTMSVFELRRRLAIAQDRAAASRPLPG